MLTHIYMEFKKKKNGTDEPSGRAGIKDIDIENGLEDTGRRGKLG